MSWNDYHGEHSEDEAIRGKHKTREASGNNYVGEMNRRRILDEEDKKREEAKKKKKDELAKWQHRTDME